MRQGCVPLGLPKGDRGTAKEQGDTGRDHLRGNRVVAGHRRGAVPPCGGLIQLGCGLEQICPIPLLVSGQVCAGSGWVRSSG